MSLFYKSKLIPPQYRKWFDAQFTAALNAKPDISRGASPKAAIEDMVEDFKKFTEEIDAKEKKSPVIIKESVVTKE